MGHERVQVDNGAGAIGHAMGCTGAALVRVRHDELARRGERGGCISIGGEAGAAGALLVAHPRLPQKAFFGTPAP